MARKRSGCRNAMFVPLENGTFNFEKKVDLKGLLEAFNYTKNYKEASNYADNVQNIYRKGLQSIDVDADFTELGLANKGVLFGATYNKGGLATSTEDKSPEGALLFEETYDNNSFVRVVFYNVTLYEKDGTNQTDGDSYNYQTDGFTGKALSFENDSTNGKKLFEFRMDSADPTVDATSFEKFYTEIQYPLAKETVTES